MALEAAGIDLVVEGPDLPFDPEAEAVLAWAVREGATNVIRHSGARKAEITVRARRAGVELEVSDDGPGAGSNGNGERAGHGLAGLIERAHALGGSVEAAPGPAGGFQLRVSLPARAGESVA